MNVLEKLLGGQARVRILRLFLLNPTTRFSSREISEKSRVKGSALRSELLALQKIKFLRKQKGLLRLSTSFEFLSPLKNLLLATEPFKDEEIVARFKNGGRIKLVLIAGIFTQGGENGSRVDILLVGDNLKRGKIERALHDMESEVGKELSYAIFDTKEFKYRMEVYDKFVRDIMDYPHKVLLDRVGVV
jgi:hypothetical protein